MRVAIRQIFTGLAVAAAMLAAGCACTLVGWTEGLTVDIEVADGAAFPDGSYSFEVVADGQPIALALDVAEGAPTCESNPCFASVDVGDGREVNLQLFVSGPGAAQVVVWRTDDGELDGGPEIATVRVVRDGGVMSELTVSPRYTSEEINGRGCGVATQSRAQLVIAAP